MSYLEQFLNNTVFFVVLFAWIFSCVLKGFLVWIRDKKLDMTRFMGSGGMPSSHSTLVTCLATCVGIKDGFDNPMFVVCCAFALVVMYDASGVRRAAGQQAKTINMIVDVLSEKDPMEKQNRLKELLGHTPLEVFAGATLGILIAVLASVTIGL
ncbi:MAG: divergent PAP2 family protein [Clostridia bacterium]|nr:divergent PAP2 family protein [Clostridia bacterium]